jgi:LacI family transcriptional regulator, galactose operon repressor
MVDLLDVAQAAGVSKSTASRALVRPELVAAATRERVLQAAAELGFNPNRAARALTTGRTGFVGLIVPTLGNPFFGPLVLEAQHAVEDSSRRVLIVASENSLAREERLLTTLANQVDGFIVVGSLASDQFLRKVAQTKPLVLVNRKVRGLPTVLIDTPSGVAEIAAHLIRLGHTRICYLSGPAGSWMDQQRRQALAERIGPASAELVVLGPYLPTVDAGIEAAPEVLAQGATAAIVYNSSIALGLLHSLAARGVRVPDQISVASADDFAFDGSADPPVTALRIPASEAGRLAVHKLSELLAGRRTSGTQVVSPALSIGTSTCETAAG